MRLIGYAILSYTILETGILIVCKKINRIERVTENDMPSRFTLYFNWKKTNRRDLRFCGAFKAGRHGSVSL